MIFKRAGGMEGIDFSGNYSTLHFLETPRDCWLLEVQEHLSKLILKYLLYLHFYQVDILSSLLQLKKCHGKLKIIR